MMSDERDRELDADLRERAIGHLKKRRDFHAHLLVYVLVNASIVVIWAVTGHGGFFWPIFVMIPWGIGVVMNAWDVYHNDDFGEVEVRREMERLDRRDR